MILRGPGRQPLVSTIRERCRVCYTCVRECPAKAIRISGGQAEVLDERCIGCGNCVRVCSQQAKHVRSSVDAVRALLAAGPAAACVAPSFPAEFTDATSGEAIAMIRALGFDPVVEVAFGADLVAEAYRRLLEDDRQGRWIATTCPAIVSYVERFHPNLVPRLAPIVSPMIATARALRRVLPDTRPMVFIGPCLAKKDEAEDEALRGEIAAVLTFTELRILLDEEAISPRGREGSDFDPPHAARGTLFPISRGLLQAAGLTEDLLVGDIVAADGRTAFQDAIREFEDGALDARLLEVLCCNGCVMGPGMTSEAPLFRRRSLVSRYARESRVQRDPLAVVAGLKAQEDLSLDRRYEPEDRRFEAPSEDALTAILERMGKAAPQDELNCGACGYDTCREHAMAILKGLAESEMCLPFTIEELRRTVRELAVSHDQLATTQEALVHSEKLASMGQLAAGIAHEVNNPLGVVLMYTHLLLEDCAPDSPVRKDLETIVEHTDRAKKIVAGLLNFARQSKVVPARTDVRELVARSLKAVTVPPSVTVVVEHEGEDSRAEVDGDQICQVLINLAQNAVAAMPEGGRLEVRTRTQGEDLWFLVRDTGTGIPPENRSRIFTPFFTTKAAGQGTGLGLAVSYGIVKMHRGDIRLESNADPTAGPTGTAFTVRLPLRRATAAETGNGA